MAMLGPRTLSRLREVLRAPRGGQIPRGQHQRFAANLPKLGKADEYIAAEASGTVQIWNGTPGSETDTTQTVTAYNYFSDVLEDEWVWCAHNGYGWYIVAKPLTLAILGKTDASHAKGASGTISIYAGTPGSETDTTINITAFNKFADIASGKWVWAMPYGVNWYITAAEC